MALENFKYITLEEIEEFKDVEKHIKDIRVLLESFDKSFENIIRTMKRTNIKTLQTDLKRFRNSWKEKYNKDSINKKSKNKNKDKIQFEDNEFLDKILTGVDLAELPSTVFKKKSKKIIFN